MAERETLAILFYLRNDKARSEDKVPIYMRITVNQKRSEMSIQRYIDPEKWNNAGGNVKGTKRDIRELNEYLDLQRSKVYKAHRELLEENKLITAVALRNRVQGKSEKQKTLVEIFEYHNNNMESLIPAEYSPSTLKRFKTTFDHVKSFLKYNYKTDDIPLTLLDHQFVSEFEHYFKAIRNCNHNTSIKYIKNLKKVVNIAINNDWLTKDPFARFSVKLKHTNREFLTQEELDRIENLQLLSPRLEQVRDVFVFACYTSLAYTDIANLTSNNIRRNVKGKYELIYSRIKTSVETKVPLLPKAQFLIEKYKGHMGTSVSGNLLPVISNQKTNIYLKEIAKAAKIDKIVTFHMARHTFATTIALANGMTIEGLSKLMAHSDIRSTQVYGKIMDKRVSEEMELVEARIIAKNENDLKQEKNG